MHILVILNWLRLEHLGRQALRLGVIGFVRRLKRLWVEKLLNLDEGGLLNLKKGSDPFSTFLDRSPFGKDRDAYWPDRVNQTDNGGNN